MPYESLVPPELLDPRVRFPEDYRRGCASKRRYPDEATAEAVRLRVETIFDRRFWTYRCVLFCDGWHLTSHAPKGGNQ